MATCSEMLAYTVGVASTGTLHVEPTLQYFDGVLWAPPRSSNGSGRADARRQRCRRRR